MANSLKMGQLMPLLFLFIGYHIYKAITKGSGLANQLFGTTEEEENTKIVGDAIKNIPVDLTKATMTVSQAKIWAEALQKAMNPISGFSPDTDGTDEVSIMYIFSQIYNKNDAKLVFREFGQRAYTTNWFLDNDKRDLLGWLREELDVNYLSQIDYKLKWMVYE